VSPKATLRCPCGENMINTALTYTERPIGETDFGLDKGYDRHYEICAICGHFFSRHNYNLESIYLGSYSECTYADNRKAVFEKISRLPLESSDNYWRCETVHEFCRRHWENHERNRLIDIGSGLGIFPARMVAKGWECTALDPDRKSTEMIEELVGCETITGDLLNENCENLFGMKYDLVTFNKVLEHVTDPVLMLQRTKRLLETDGLIYFEVPDGEEALKASRYREEFFIEHHHVFSVGSVSMLTRSAGLNVLQVTRVKEPSSKFTLRVFCKVS